MLHDIVSYLRAERWKQWNILFHRCSTDVLWEIFNDELDYPAIVARQYPAGAPAARGRREADALERLKHLRDELGIPTVLFRTELSDGEFLLIRSGMPGHTLADQLRLNDYRELNRQIHCVEPWLRRFQRRMGTYGSMCDALLLSIRGCEEKMTTLSLEEKQLFAAAKDISPMLGCLPAVAVHGDFWGGNILSYGGGISVIDWETLHYGSMLEDAYQFLIGAVLCDSIPDEELMWRIFVDGSRAGQIAKLVTFQMLEDWQVAEDLLYPLFLMFLVSCLHSTEFRVHAGWRRFVSRYVRAGMPPPFATSGNRY